MNASRWIVLLAALALTTSACNDDGAASPGALQPSADSGQSPGENAQPAALLTPDELSAALGVPLVGAEEPDHFVIDDPDPDFLPTSIVVCGEHVRSPAGHVWWDWEATPTEDRPPYGVEAVSIVVQHPTVEQATTSMDAAVELANACETYEWRYKNAAGTPLFLTTTEVHEPELGDGALVHVSAYDGIEPPAEACNIVVLVGTEMRIVHVVLPAAQLDGARCLALADELASRGA